MNANKRTVTASQLRKLLESQGYRCAYTGVELTPATASLDHRTPASRGGEHKIENMAIVTAEVNSAKGTMTLEEFIAMCRAVAAHAEGLTRVRGSLEEQ